MLAAISHPMPPSYAPFESSAPPPPPSTMATSLPIIPRPAPALPQRPKLQIDTQQLRTFGKGSTSLRLDTLSAVSPTVRNTFSNAYDESKPRLSIDSSCSNAPSSSTPSSASTLSSTLTSASYDDTSLAVPYKQPHNLTSILSNSPAQSLLPRKMASGRPLFPAEKRVSFREPLEEEITTVKYTVAHSDLESSCSTLSSLESASTSSSGSEQTATSHSLSTTKPANPSSPSVQSPSEHSASNFASVEGSPRSKNPRAGEKRESSSDEDSDSCPETPVAGRRKRRRDWRWTLGPLPGSTTDKSTCSASASDETASEDSS